MSAKKHITVFPVVAIGLACAASLVAPSPACGEPVILWNKLGSDAEVTNSEIGSDGIIVGDISYGPGQFDNGFQPEWRTGDHNIPDNYVRFNDLNLGQQGTIEFWFHPDWIAPGYSHCRDILWYGKANPNRRCLLYFQYNDWQNRLNLYLFDDYLTSAFVKRFIVPANTPEWSTTEPFHVAITWDGTAADNADKLKLFLNGNERGALASSGAPTFDDWDNTNYMCLASRTIEGDWVRHNWEGSDGIIDNIKIWDYPKTDFSDRFVEGVLLPCQANELAKLLASDGAEEDVFGYGVAISGDTAVIGAKRDDDNGSNSGSAYVFQFDGSGWVQQAKLLASDGAANDEFGTSVAISGNTIVVGATRKVDHRGSAYVYERPVGGWADMTETARLSPSDTLASGDRFGIVAISGDTVVVTAHRYDQNGLSESGTAYLYVKPPGGWVDMMSQTAKLTASDLAAYDMCGSGVGIDGDTVVVNSADDNDNGVDAGSAYVFEKPPGGWVNMTETAKLTASDGAAVDQMGWFSAVISGNTVVLGAPWDDNENGTKAGSAYVYEKPPGGWVNMTETAKLMASDGAPGDELGFGVAVSGDTLVVGAYEDDDNGDGSGSAYVFQRPAGGWVATTESAKLTASDGAPGDHFGCYFSVSVSGDTAMAGAYGDDDNGSGSGSVYVFRGLGDCNENGTLDICDVAEGTSADINANGVPDESREAPCRSMSLSPT